MGRRRQKSRNRHAKSWYGIKYNMLITSASIVPADEQPKSGNRAFREAIAAHHAIARAHAQRIACCLI